MNLKKIRELAEKATPGDWRWSYHQLVSGIQTEYTEGMFDDTIIMNEPGINKPEKPDKDYIAAVNPKVMLDILDYIAMLEFYIGPDATRIIKKEKFENFKG